MQPGKCAGGLKWNRNFGFQHFQPEATGGAENAGAAGGGQQIAAGQNGTVSKTLPEQELRLLKHQFTET